MAEDRPGCADDGNHALGRQHRSGTLPRRRNVPVHRRQSASQRRHRSGWPCASPQDGGGALHRRNAGCCPPRTGRAGISMPAECRRQPGRDYGPTIAVAPTVSSGPAAARRCTRGGIPSPQERNTAPSSAGAAGFHGPGHNRTRTPEPECLHRGWPEPMRKLCYRRRR